MVEHGALATVELPNEPSRYERADMEHHHHFQCTECQRVFDIEGCSEHIDKLAPKGFTVEHHEVVLYGRCPECPESP